MIKALDSFMGLSVDDLRQAKDFYIEKLGLALLDETMGLRITLPGGGELFIYEKQSHTPADYTVLNFVVDNIDSAVDELLSRGITFEHYDNLPAKQDDKQILRGKSVQMGPDIAWFKDPAGNILSIVENMNT